MSWLFGGNGDEGFQQQFGDAADFGHLSMERHAETPSSRRSQQLGRIVSFSPDTAENVPRYTTEHFPVRVLTVRLALHPARRVG